MLHEACFYSKCPSEASDFAHSCPRVNTTSRIGKRPGNLRTSGQRYHDGRASHGAEHPRFVNPNTTHLFQRPSNTWAISVSERTSQCGILLVPAHLTPDAVGL
ncbi:hypothetical protein BV20DRAFT_784119 [Pilatotrama ljubarskyi]|nr:hypothetical protein BV20DRAFT_119644 [Pilatotrama ljubarskyi]KAI0365104.1 hypothetical protein BV20DRAFT_784119 [Pilatotrama ljubarskyi]